MTMAKPRSCLQSLTRKWLLAKPSALPWSSNFTIWELFGNVESQILPQTLTPIYILTSPMKWFTHICKDTVSTLAAHWNPGLFAHYQVWHGAESRALPGSRALTEEEHVTTACLDLHIPTCKGNYTAIFFFFLLSVYILIFLLPKLPSLSRSGPLVFYFE